jgi:hypothetical protein
MAITWGEDSLYSEKTLGEILEIPRTVFFFQNYSILSVLSSSYKARLLFLNPTDPKAKICRPKASPKFQD